MITRCTRSSRVPFSWIYAISIAALLLVLVHPSYGQGESAGCRRDSPQTVAFSSNANAPGAHLMTPTAVSAATTTMTSSTTVHHLMAGAPRQTKYICHWGDVINTTNTTPLV